jgi:hypothetical protein
MNDWSINDSQIYIHQKCTQTYWRTQKQSSQSVNIINEIVDFVESLVDLGITSVTIDIVLQAFQTLIELVQGPCKANQELLVHSNLPGLCMYILEHNDYPGCEKGKSVAVQNLQEACALFLSSLLEACSDPELPTSLARDLDMQKIIKFLRVR